MTHVLVARMDRMGDVLLSGPLVRAVAASAERVTYLAGPAGAPAARLLPGVDEVIVARAPWIEDPPPPVRQAEIDDLIACVAGLGVDTAVILTSFHQSPLPLALVLRLAGVPCIGAVSVDYPGSLLDVRHRIDDDVHEVRRALSLGKAMGFHPPPDDDNRLRVSLADPVVPPDLPTDGYLVVHPGTSVPARAWAAANHAALVRRLTASGYRVVVTGGPSERRVTAEVAGGRGIDAGGRLDLPGLAAVIARARAIVVANTGPAHLAAAVGTPVVSLFAPTVPPGRWRPWMVPHMLLGNHDIACAGCRARICPVAGHPCLDPLEPVVVHRAVDQLIGGSANDGPAVGLSPAAATNGAGGKVIQ